jgi:uncharacterized membrane protein YidH (DUF202 family)
VTRDLKFGYGFSLAGVGLPYLLDKAFGALPALIVASIFTLLGIGFLIAGHVHKEQDDSTAPRRQNYVASTVIATLAIGVVVWFAVRTFRQPAPDTPAHSGKASIFFGEGVTSSGSELPMEFFEAGYEVKAYAGDDSAVASMKMKPNGRVSLDVSVVDDKGASLIKIHDDEFTVASTLDRNSNESAYEAIDADGLVVFQLKRKSPAEIVINGVFKMKSGIYFLAGPKGSIETPNVRYDYAPKPLFKYPSWRFPGIYADETRSSGQTLTASPPSFHAVRLLLAVFVIGIAVATFVLVYMRYRPHGLGVRAGVGTRATLTAYRLVPTDDGPQVQLEYEWHDDDGKLAADRKDKPLHLINPTDRDAMNVQISPIGQKWKAKFELIPTVSKRNSPLSIKPTVEYHERENEHVFEPIKNNFSIIFLKSDMPGPGESENRFPILISYSDIQGRDYNTYYVLKYDRAKGQAIALFERWGRLVEVKKLTFLGRCQRFVLNILGREQS